MNNKLTEWQKIKLLSLRDQYAATLDQSLKDKEAEGEGADGTLLEDLIQMMFCSLNKGILTTLMPNDWVEHMLKYAVLDRVLAIRAAEDDR